MKAEVWGLESSLLDRQPWATNHSRMPSLDPLCQTPYEAFTPQEGNLKLDVKYHHPIIQQSSPITWVPSCSLVSQPTPSVTGLGSSIQGLRPSLCLGYLAHSRSGSQLPVSPVWAVNVLPLRDAPCSTCRRPGPR